MEYSINQQTPPATMSKRLPFHAFEGQPLRCVLMGDQSLLMECATVLLARGHIIQAVVTESRAVANWARERNLLVLGAGTNLESDLTAFAYDWFFSIANLRVVPQAIWRRATQGAANFHDGPLPRYAGLNAPAWVILNGEDMHGVTWHLIADMVDAGAILAQRHFPISEDETSFTLNGKCFEAGIASFSELLADIEAGALNEQPQDLTKRSYYGRFLRPGGAGILGFDQPSGHIERLSRALDFGPGYDNPLATAKLWTGEALLGFSSLKVVAADRSAPPGTVLGLDEGVITVATADGAVEISGLRDIDGRQIDLQSIFSVGGRLPLISHAAGELKEATEKAARSEAFFLPRLVHSVPPELSAVKPARNGPPSQLRTIGVTMPEALSPARCIAALLAALLRETGQHMLDIAYTDTSMWFGSPLLAELHARTVPLRASIEPDTGNAAFEQSLMEEIGNLGRLGSLPADIFLRHPSVNPPELPVGLRTADHPSAAHAISDCLLTFVTSSAADAGPEKMICVVDEGQVDGADVEALIQRIEIAAAAFALHPEGLVSDLPLMSDKTRHTLVSEINRTEVDYQREACIHHLIELQMDRSPGAVALAFGNKELTYRELDDRANRVAAALRARGIGPEKLVGLHVGRSLDLVIGALGILKAGAAYVPLDPTYPAERLRYMVEHSGTGIILTQRAMLAAKLAEDAAILCMEDVPAEAGSEQRLSVEVSSSNLAYVIYTSGSTGRPKGVMIEHRNVVNFFAGMDERVPWRNHAHPTWLAVTSLSFDIAVLELFWTLARGFKVVIAQPPMPVRTDKAGGASERDTRKIDFGLFFWGNDDGAGAEKYRLLLEGAKFADTNGFTALWTPERHFHAFGGPFPNPAVTGAAVAALTRNLSIRAGSCVLPLHHPARVAEEWAVVDNLCGGRVGLAFASGWMPEDFLLRPENAPPRNKEALLRDIDVVRRLWRGEPVPFAEPGGRTLDVTTQPRPVQKELPVWVTSAGNPETYREAARLGANVLTHLLGQSIAELADKIAIYRQTLRDCGQDPEAFKVTVMLHTFLGGNRDEVRDRVREPMKAYLRSAVGLIKQYAWAFPAFTKPTGIDKPMDIDLQSVSPEDMDAIVEFAFQRYFEDSGFFGTPADALRRVRQLQAIGVDEIACLIDFGVEYRVALEGLQPLAQVVAETARLVMREPEPSVEESLGSLIRRHNVTHLQCTPSMASMILATPDDRAALAGVEHLFIGGEALHGALVAELRAATPATIENMYGPTETTIWSSTQRVSDADGIVPLGQPIANTRLYVLDAKLRPVPPGHTAELFIGGDGVARGYLNQPDLTAERFVDNPFEPADRLYRTGDLVRFDDEFVLHYVSRADHQVKIRGYRIELGEIEARLRELPGIKEAIAVVREDRPGDHRIIAYLQAEPGAADPADLRAHMVRVLPDFMVPSQYVAMEHLPLTPNAKIDRNALPRPEEVVSASDNAAAFVAPADGMERAVAELFGRLLGLKRVGAQDNFFVLGGHSLLAVQAHRELKATLAPGMSITDLFRFPTASSLATHLAGGNATNSKLAAASTRAQSRRGALAARADALRRLDRVD